MQESQAPQWRTPREWRGLKRAAAIFCGVVATFVTTMEPSFARTTIRLTDLSGADPSGKTSSVSSLREACLALNEAGGGELIIPAGVYKIDSTVDCSQPPHAQTADWWIVFEAGGKLVASSRLTTSALKIFSSSLGRHSLEIVAPDMDVSGGVCPVACQAREGLTAIEVQDQNFVAIIDPHLVGGASYYNANSNNGVTCTRVGLTAIRGGTISGFPNGGVYCVGDLKKNRPGDYRLKIERTRFIHNNVGVECKFSLEECRVEDSVFEHNRYGLGTFRAGRNGSEPSARSVFFLRNRIRRSLRAAIWIEETGRGVIAGNVMEDVGYDEENKPTARDVQFLMFNGAGGIEIADNVARQSEGSGERPTGVVIGNAWFDGKEYQAGHIHATRNTFHGVSRGVYEGPNVDASHFFEMDAEATKDICTTTNAETICETLPNAPQSR